MKKKLLIIGIMLLGIIGYQGYYYVKHKSNSLIIVGNQDKNMNEEVTIFINDKEIKRFNLGAHFSFIDNHNLSFGKNKITLKNTKSDIIFETTISYYGLFSWNYIEYNNGEFYFDKYYISRSFQ